MEEIKREDGRPAGSIYLIGFMGAGKTTVSRSLRGLLGIDEIDIDEMIVSETGMPVAEIFERYGEEYFREKETEAVRRIAEGDPVIVSCGGGCVLREENVSLLKRSGTTVLLTAEPETIYERVKDGTERPILNGHMDVDYIAGLMEQRREAYEAACDIILPTDGRTPEDIAGDIAKEIAGKG